MVRFLAIQCPECEGPEGDWRTVRLPFGNPASAWAARTQRYTTAAVADITAPDEGIATPSPRR